MWVGFLYTLNSQSTVHVNRDQRVHCRPDDDLSDRSKHVVISTISKYSPVKDVLVFFISYVMIHYK